MTPCTSIKKPEALAGALGLPNVSLGRLTLRKMPFPSLIVKRAIWRSASG